VAIKVASRAPRAPRGGQIMKPRYVVLCIASLITTVAACVVDPLEDDAAEVEESRAALVFAPGDPDITWSGPATYSGGWAQQSFKPTPGLYIDEGSLGPTRGAVYLSATTLCVFSSYNETSQRLYINSNDCSGPFNALTVSLDCLKQPGFLACAGSLATAGGLQSTVSASMERENVCGLSSCYIGPLDPMPPGPDGPADCGEGESPCGNGCCLKGERCGDGHCYIPEEEDEQFSER
jgi:hypothetical protein